MDTSGDSTGVLPPLPASLGRDLAEGIAAYYRSRSASDPRRLRELHDGNPYRLAASRGLRINIVDLTGEACSGRLFKLWRLVEVEQSASALTRELIVAHEVAHDLGIGLSEGEDHKAEEWARTFLGLPAVTR